MKFVYSRSNVRNRMLFFFAIQATILIFLVYLLVKVLILNEFNTIAQDTAEKEMINIVTTLNGEINTLKSTTLDYSTDDSLYELMKPTSNPEKAQQNMDAIHTTLNSRLGIANMITLRLSGVYILSEDGKIIYSNEYDYLQRRIPFQEEVANSPTFKDYITDSSFYSRIHTRDVLNGMVSIGDEIILVSAQPILTANLDGPMRGSLIMTRHLDMESFKNVFPTITMKQAESINNSDPKDNMLSIENLNVQSIISKEKEQKGTSIYHTSCKIEDILEENYIEIAADPYDSYYTQSVISINFLFTIIIFITIILLFTTWLYMTRYVVSRIQRIVGEISTFINENEQDNPLSISSTDEFSLIEQNVEKLIDHLKHSHSTLRKLAHVDSLTGLYNRLGFNEKIIHTIRKSRLTKKKFAFFFIDIDRFKYLNDTYGHKIGDAMLQEFSNRLQASVPNKALLCRISGDEFVIIIPNIKDEKEVTHHAQKIVDTLNEPYTIESIVFHNSASIGISIFPTHGDTIEALMTKADLAMYHRKNTTRNGFMLYNDSMERRINDVNIRKAIDQNEFSLMFQPQFDIKTNQMIGMETLLRWHHPKYGMVSPMEFIPVAEETGLIIEITEWIIEHCFMQLQNWNAQGFHGFQLSINLSTLHLRKGKQLILYIKKMLKKYQINENRIVFELTETVSIGLSDDVIETLRELHHLGIEIEIDDFGKEYSVLNYLQHLPITGLKIDRSFIKEITKNDKIVRMIVALAHALQLKVIAEGVETEEQKKILEAIGCKIVQGYLYEKPLSCDDLTKKHLKKLA